MDKITSYTLNREDTIANLGILAQTEFGVFDHTVIVQAFFEPLNDFLKPLKDDLWYITETPYIDKVYRDSFYMFYSSKFDEYSRNCIKISIWSKNVEMTEFEDETSINNLQSFFLGFIIIRPTFPNIIGRNAISPHAFKKHNFRVCTTSIGVTVNGVKFVVDAFPTSSQDEETMTCAEICIWACMEYFAFRYAEYRPVLPSDIVKALNDKMVERQLPSQGLTIEMIASTMKKFGFGTKVYSRDVYKAQFDALISIYIESGIPLILAIEKEKPHAIITIGRSVWQETHISRKPVVFGNKDSKDKNYINIYEWNNTDTREYVFVDDNKTPYQQATIKKATLEYGEVEHFVVPLYSKVYLEAFKAKNLIEQLLCNKVHFPIEFEQDGTDIVTRLYLVSSRSYKHWLRTKCNMDYKLKEMIIAVSMPKLIWVCELGGKLDFIQKKASGLIILDSTESNLQFFNPLILAAFKGNFLIFAPEQTHSIDNQHLNKEFKLKNFGEKNKVNFGQFDIFEENLTNYDNS